MIRPEPYVAAEPGVTTMYVDVKGRLHETRDAAIQANFDSDFAEAVVGVADANELRDPDNKIVSTVRSFILQHPDMVRVLLGDRDAT